MGSGISLTDYQLTEIIKRDLAIEYQQIISKRKPCYSLYEEYRNWLDGEKYYRQLKQINDSLEQRQSKKKTGCVY